MELPFQNWLEELIKEGSKRESCRVGVELEDSFEKLATDKGRYS